MKKIKGALSAVLILPVIFIFFLIPILFELLTACLSASLLYLFGLEFTSIISFILFIVAYLVVIASIDHLLDVIAFSLQVSLDLSTFSKNIIYSILSIPVSVTVIGLLEYIFKGVSCSIETAFMFTIACAVINIISDIVIPPELPV